MALEYKQRLVKAFLEMDLRDSDATAHDDRRIRDHLVYQIMEYPAFALPQIDSPVLIGGFVHSFGAATAWMVTGRGFSTAARRVLRQQRVLCASIYDALALRRLEIEVVTGRWSAERWAQALGFEFEGVRRRAGVRGEDMSVYVWPQERSAA